MLSLGSAMADGFHREMTIRNLEAEVCALKRAAAADRHDTRISSHEEAVSSLHACISMHRKEKIGSLQRLTGVPLLALHPRRRRCRMCAMKMAAQKARAVASRLWAGMSRLDHCECGWRGHPGRAGFGRHDGKHGQEKEEEAIEGAEGGEFSRCFAPRTRNI